MGSGSKADRVRVPGSGFRVRIGSKTAGNCVSRAKGDEAERRGGGEDIHRSRFEHVSIIVSITRQEDSLSFSNLIQ
jgi:hypothetical protein